MESDIKLPKGFKEGDRSVMKIYWSRNGERVCDKRFLHSFVVEIGPGGRVAIPQIKLDVGPSEDLTKVVFSAWLVDAIGNEHYFFCMDVVPGSPPRFSEPPTDYIN